ncbi:MAG TPA: F0F1 ATP synthase subunit A [Gemmatimonadales bacterium]|jgi:F-type H+-transporting ATPase subunit a|nr:F0F1 ATP synthase subunit A [Gemmatimonadales bacterium]
MIRSGRLAMVGLTAALLGAGFAPMASLMAQEPTGEVAREAVAPRNQAQAARDQIDIVHHIGNSHEVETPFGVWHLPEGWTIPLGTAANGEPRSLDLSPTKHMVYMVLAALIVALTFLLSARSISAAQARGRPSKGFAGAMEAMALYIRQEVVLPNVGPHGEGFTPYLLTLFFFILTMNLLGLLPWGATPTGNITVTAALAIIAFLVIEVTGMRALGPKGYLGTIFYLPHGLPGGVGGSFLKVVLLAVLTPIELIGKLAKPFALAVRLFANMTSGHVLVLALIGLTFLFQSYTVGVAAALLATGVMLLELFVAFLQAFVFTLLTSVFIGLMRAEH